MSFRLSKLWLFAMSFACSVGLRSSSTVCAFSTSTTTTSSRLFNSHFDKASLAENTVALTYLEINGWLLSTGGLTILIDPILEGSLDFGIPAVYSASKRILPPTGLCDSLPPIDCLLITQGLDDHAHERTLKKLNQLDSSIPIIAPPSARGALEKSGFVVDVSNISFLQPGNDMFIESRKTTDHDGNDQVKIRATTGALVGPPWQARENGYIVSSSTCPSVYIEPHVENNARELKREGPVDIVITPISGQGLPAFELVHGPSDAFCLVQSLAPKYVLPMQNGDVDALGFASPLIQTIGSPKEFMRMLDRAQTSEGAKRAEVVDVVPGEDILLSI